MVMQGNYVLDRLVRIQHLVLTENAQADAHATESRITTDKNSEKRYCWLDSGLCHQIYDRRALVVTR